MKIIYPNDNGGICVIHPADDTPIEFVAFKDVPQGKPYLFVDDAEIDALDRSKRDGWTAEFSNPDGIGGQS